MLEKALNEHVVTYLSRLTGESLTLDTPLRLRSVQRAAFSSWARQQQLPVRLAVISSSVPFSIQDLLMAEKELATVPEACSAPAQLASIAPSSQLVAAAGVGIDIEEIENLPEADDYREHSFYQDNFTPAEISFCVRQPNVRASFCGCWAAKEAILKSGQASAPAGHLKGIEVRRDNLGRPLYPGCSVSISHTARTAVAICTSAPAC